MVKNILYSPIEQLSAIGGMGLNALHYGGIKTIGKLVRTKESKIRRLPIIGDATVFNIRQALAFYNLNLKPEVLCFGENLPMTFQHIDLLSFKPPTVAALKQHNVWTIGQLIYAGRTNLTYGVGFDLVTLNNIQKALALYNLSLRP